MNRLQFETSPYLLQHAHNPVDWYAWKPEAFERAKKEDKPILVSIGYSTCHWCHVMERESFENSDVAAIMNENFINIKVDREERPDVDHIYMEACVIMTGSGGWPLNCFLTPDGRPFLAGTYYPPIAAFNRPSWPQLLHHVTDVYRNRRKDVEEQASRLIGNIEQTNSYFLAKNEAELSGINPFNPVVLHNVFQTLKKNFDLQDGGFGGAPKFPGSMALQFLLDYHHFTGETAALEHTVFSLDRMIRGGIYDQLGGGFARYATDRAWLVPHFEKMLYDNALLVGLLSDTYKVTQQPIFRRAIEETLAWVEREMTSPDGGFYSALDADSEGEEGKFYVWSAEEIAAACPSAEDAALFSSYYGVEPLGNWEGHNILWCPLPLEAFAVEVGQSPEALEARFAPIRTQLMSVRDERIRPGLDDKILLSWNALMASAYAKAYTALGNETYKVAALRNVDFLLEKFKMDEIGGLYHTYKKVKDQDQAQYAAFLDDYAYFIAALIDVYEISLETRYLRQAADLTEYTLAHFLDGTRNLFYFTSKDQQDVVLRKIELYDNALPSGNSSMVQNLQRLGLLWGKMQYIELAAAMLKEMLTGLERYPSSFARWANALIYMVYPMHEVAIVGPAAAELSRELQKNYIPNKVLMGALEADDTFPLLAGRQTQGSTQIFVCQNYTCQLPVSTSAEALALLT